MSARTSLRPFLAIDAESMGASITSTPTVLQSLTMVNYEIVWTGSTPVGTVSVEASNTCTVGSDGTVSGGTWTAIPLDLNGVTVTSIPLSGNSGTGMIDIDGLSAYAVRLKYTRSSGTGTMSATVVGKVA